jgi:hypothetical protein
MLLEGGERTYKARHMETTRESIGFVREESASIVYPITIS